MNWYFGVLKKYAVFTGRARRSEYWFFVLFNLIVSFGLMFADMTLKTMVGQGTMQFGILNSIYSLAVFIPSLAVGVRRLHDVNKTGWMMLIGLIPVIGAIWLLVLFVTPGTAGENKYGADPKAA